MGVAAFVTSVQTAPGIKLSVVKRLKVPAATGQAMVNPPLACDSVSAGMRTTVSVKVSLVESKPSLTVSVTLAVPVWLAAG